MTSQAVEACHARLRDLHTTNKGGQSLAFIQKLEAEIIEARKNLYAAMESEIFNPVKCPYCVTPANLSIRERPEIFYVHCAGCGTKSLQAATQIAAISYWNSGLRFKEQSHTPAPWAPRRKPNGFMRQYAEDNAKRLSLVAARLAARELP